MEIYFESTEHVRATSGAENMVLLDLRSGKYFALNAVGSLLWEGISSGASRGSVLGRLAERFPGVPLERLERDADAMVRQLRDRGLLRPRNGPPREEEAKPQPLAAAPAPAASPRSEAGGTAETGAARASALWVPIAYLGLLISDAILKLLGFSRFHALVRRLPARSTARGSAAQARRIVRSVDQASAFYFKRAWCLQRSAVTVALLRLAGLPAHLVIGIQRIPFYAHAWVELEGRVVNDQPAVRRRFETLETC